MVPVRWLPLLLLTACGDDVVATSDPTGGPASTTSATDVSAGQTSAPEPDTTTPTTGTPDPTATTTATTTSEDPATTATTDDPGTTGQPAQCTTLEFDDPGLEIQIKEFLAIEGKIPLEVALGTEELRLFADWQIDGLGGLECFVNLRVFESDSAGIVMDLTPLSQLAKLERLVLPHSWITDLTPLAGLPALTTLDLRTTKLTDLTPLADLPALVDLTVGKNQLADFTSLAGHPTLTRFTAHDLAGTSLAGLAQIPHLEFLSLEHNTLADLGPLAGAPVLRELHLADNQIVDLAPLAGLATLVELHAPGNQITAVPLASLTQLEILDVGINHITDPTPLGKLPTLRELTLNDNPLTNGIASLAGLAKLERLNVARTGITKLAAIAPTTLLALHASENKLVDLTPLADHSALTTLDLFANAIESIHPIVAAPFWANKCVEANVAGNPLDTESLEVDLPALCAGDDAIVFPDIQQCGNCVPMP